MEKIKKYQWYVGVAVASVVAGAIVFFESIVNTVKGNPHPQINYIIFVLIGAGCALIWLQVARMLRDARFIQEFYELARGNPEPGDLRAMLENGGKSDTKSVLEIVADVFGKPVTPLQHAALEAELARYKTLQSRYLILPQYLSGMMVGMGLLGTFIGLLGALAEIGNLIAAFSMTNSGDAVGAIKMLIERLTAPMQAMGVAFSASLFGVLGSLIMGVLLVALKNCAGELNNMIESRVTYLTDFTSSDVADVNVLGDAIASLAEQSPILKGLGQALDQSERRVRELINSMIQLTSRIERGERNTAALLEGLQESQAREAEVARILAETQSSLGVLANRWATATQMEAQIANLLQQQQGQMEQMQTAMTQSNLAQQDLNSRLVASIAQSQLDQANAIQQLGALNDAMLAMAEGNKIGLQDIAGVQRRSANELSDVVQAAFKDLAGIQRRESDAAMVTLQSGLKDLSETIQTGFQDLTGIQRRESDTAMAALQNGLKGLTEAISDGFKDFAGVQRRESDASTAAMQSGLKDLAGAQRRASEDSSRELREMLGRLGESLTASQSEQRVLLQQVARISDALTSMTTLNHQGLQSIVEATQRNFEGAMQEQISAANQMVAALERNGQTQQGAMQGLTSIISQMGKQIQEEALVNSQLINRLELLFSEMGLRQEQLTEALMRNITAENAQTA